ncbi:di-trans,poly-cis-decaprenylcistransferase [Batrachochytrium salamandrivorans]|nr:di-trans,poly-cis-decaprenylcistransferase [Batrachochytrium salamandrivorans]
MEARTQLAWYHRVLLGVLRRGGVPRHVAFIMDGNRRFAQQRQQQVQIGHALGFDSLLLMLELCLELGVEVVTVYAFSEENFTRPQHEVEGLMQLATCKFGEFLEQDHLVMQHGVVVNMFGRIELLPLDVQQAAARVVMGTRLNKGNLTLNVCFAYSGASEVRQAMRRASLGLCCGDLLVGDVTCELITALTYLDHLPSPDLLIRTSGETRLSDFMLWHLAHTKLSFVTVLWPELSIWDLVACVADWQCDRHQPESKPHAPCPRVSAFLAKVEVEKLSGWQRLLDPPPQMPKPSRPKKPTEVKVREIHGAHRVQSDEAVAVVVEEEEEEEPEAAKPPRRKRVSEPFQLLRPKSQDREIAYTSPVDVLDAVTGELARDVSGVERALLGENTTFRVVGALGSQGSGRSTLLFSLVSKTLPPSSPKSPRQMELFVHQERRIWLVDFPPVCNSGSWRKVDAPKRAYDRRVVFTALTTCQTVLLVVDDGGEEAHGQLVELVREAKHMAEQRNWPCAQLVWVRNRVPVSQSLSQRRIQCDERILGREAAVVHVPKREKGGEEAHAQAMVRLAKAALHSLPSMKQVNLLSPQLPVATESEWFAQFLHIFHEARAQSL